jgi:uridine kinase
MKKISVTFPDGGKEIRPYGLRAAELVPRFGELATPLAAVLINNELCSVYQRLEVNCKIAPVCLGDGPMGAAVYRRSLCFLLAIAARELFPERTLVLGHSLGHGYYHTFRDDNPVGKDEIEKLQARMRGIVAEDQAIKHAVISYQDALRSFERSKQDETLLLLKQMNSSRIPVNTCRGFMDLAIAPLVPSSGVLKCFELMPYEQGFILRYPPAGKFDVLGPFQDNPVLYSIYKEYKRWGRILGLSSVGSLNRMNRPKEIKGFIQVAEALHNKKIAEIADKIAQRSGNLRAILIAGPSSSGKTTFSKKLSIQLTVLGLRPISISLDDYFVDRSRTPRDEKGEVDFECLEALDVDYLNEQLIQLFSGGKVELPLYDFKSGSRKPSGKMVEMGERDVLIMEGIHGLNDKLTHRIPREQKFKVYVSALTQLNLDDHNRIPTTDNRLIRRMVRDFQFRGHGALDTLRMWPSVQRGEQAYIFPFQNTADAAFNSALDYELSVLKIYAEPLLKDVKPYDVEYAEAMRILSFLDYFTAILPQHVPKDSILREFIGESEFKY